MLKTKSHRPAEFIWHALAVAASLAIGLGTCSITRADDPVANDPIDGDPIDGERAMKYLHQICRFGPRPTASPAMVAQRQWLEAHFKQAGAQVRRQEFQMRHPLSGEGVAVVNLIAAFHPDRSNRILLAAHYDTRPFPDEERDPSRRRGVFLGANDGGSGVALLCEFARHLSTYHGPYGVDIVLFDAEEFVFGTNRDRYFVGSEYFARDYASRQGSVRYRAGILFDMVGDADLQIYKERFSVQYAPGLVRDIWKIAKELNVKEFRSKIRHEVRDDHLPLNRIARIPTIDLIDFDYPRPGVRGSYWHTQADTPDKCSAESLATVGRVVWTWLNRIR